MAIPCFATYKNARQEKEGARSCGLPCTKSSIEENEIKGTLNILYLHIYLHYKFRPSIVTDKE